MQNSQSYQFSGFVFAIKQMIATGNLVTILVGLSADLQLGKRSIYIALAQLGYAFRLVLSAIPTPSVRIQVIAVNVTNQYLPYFFVTS